MNKTPPTAEPSLTAPSVVVDILDCRYGPMLAIAGDQVITRSLEVYGEWSEHEIDALSNYIGDGAMALDVGANIGTHALAFARRKPQAIVWGFEPQPLVCSLAAVNCARNGATNAAILQVACGAEAGEIILGPPNAEGKNAGGLTLPPHAAETDAPDVEPVPPLMRVRVATLDSFSYPRPVSLIKIDVEGMEPAVLAGAQALLARDRPVVYFETLSAVEELEAPFAMLSQLGYRLFWMETHQFNRANFKRHRKSIWAQTEMGVLALPEGVAPHADLARVDGIPTFLPRRLNAKFGVVVGNPQSRKSGADPDHEHVDMSEAEDVTFWNKFFSLKTAGEAQQFASNIEEKTPFATSLKYYMNTWQDVLASDVATPFDPTAYVSIDRSAIMYGTDPVIFEGTNFWSHKPYLSSSYIDDKLSVFVKHIAAIRSQFPGKKITLLVVPEKDYIISALLLGEQRFAAMRDGLYEFGRKLNDIDVDLIYDGPISEIGRFLSLKDFEYPDSHLHCRIYISLFGRVVKSFGGEWPAVERKIAFGRINAFGDLSEKLTSLPRRTYEKLVPEIKEADVKLKDGLDTFGSPLGNTWQLLENSQPLIPQSVCILGDSHSSIFALRNLTYLVASTYQQCAFRWNPCGIREKPKDIEQDHILLEISARFIF